jgi:AP-4 complex subunit epsilon-1
LAAQEDPDETLRRKTLDLLVKITNTQNVPVIIDKLVRYLRGTTDSFLRLELVSRMTQVQFDRVQLAERYAPSSSWYIHAMNTILELGGPLVRPEVPHTMMRLIAEGSQAAVDGDQVRLDCVVVLAFHCFHLVVYDRRTRAPMPRTHICRF